MSLLQPTPPPERFDVSAALYRSACEIALPWMAYLATANAAQLPRWQAAYEKSVLTEAQRTLLGGFTRRMPVLVISGIWCGDCIREGALLQRIAEAAPSMELRFLDRDQTQQPLREALHTLGAPRVPATLVFSEDHWFVDRLGDRSLASYRRMARAQLGESCPTGIGSPATDELASAMQDLVDRFERARNRRALTSCERAMARACHTSALGSFVYDTVVLARRNP